MTNDKWPHVPHTRNLGSMVRGVSVIAVYWNERHFLSQLTAAGSLLEY